MKEAERIAFWSMKGGVGRTTLAALTGITLAEKGKRVVMIDMDLEAPSLDLFFLSPIDRESISVDGIILEIQEKEGIYKGSVLRRKVVEPRVEQLNEQRLAVNDDFKEKFLHTKDCSEVTLANLPLRLLPASRNLIQLTRIDYEREFAKRFGYILDSFNNCDYIIVDCRAGISDPAAAVLENVKKVFVISRADTIHTELLKVGLLWIKEKNWTIERELVLNMLPERSKRLVVEFYRKYKKMLKEYFNLEKHTDIKEIYFQPSLLKDCPAICNGKLKEEVDNKITQCLLGGSDE
jgi:MinD-like ATPase involved in chromosome partitioning or flagellar assembly